MSYLCIYYSIKINKKGFKKKHFIFRNGKPTSIITHNLTEEDQSTVSTNGSYCEQDFKSLLVLNFRYSQMSILFEREEIKTNHKEASYCDGCVLCLKLLN